MSKQVLLLLKKLKKCKSHINCSVRIARERSDGKKNIRKNNNKNKIGSVRLKIRKEDEQHISIKNQII